MPFLQAALAFAVLALSLVAAWAALPTAPPIVARSIRTWVQRRFRRKPVEAAVHETASGGSVAAVGWVGRGSGYATPTTLDERVDLLWRWAEENRAEHRDITRRLTTAEQRLKGHDERFESERTARSAAVEQLRHHIAAEQDAGLRVNAHAFPAVVLAILIDSTTTWLVRYPGAGWVAVALAAIVIVPTAMSGWRHR